MVARIPGEIEVYGARVHNLRSVDVRVPLHKIVGIAGVSGSGKSSLALGVLYAEGSRRYLEALSTYTRRRLTQALIAVHESGDPLLPVGAFEMAVGEGGKVIGQHHGAVARFLIVARQRGGVRPGAAADLG